MLPVAVIWSSIFVSSSLAVNLFALGAFLNSWPLYREPPGDRVRPKKERVGYFVFLFVIFCNLVYLIFGKIPFLHRDLYSDLREEADSFLLGPGLCLWTHLLEQALSLVQFNSLCFYLGSVWLRMRRRRTPTTNRRRFLPPPSSSSEPTDSTLKDVSLLIGASLAWCLVVAAVVTYRMKLNSSEDHALLCLTTWRDSLWLSAFRWTLGHFGPFGLIGLPALVRLCAMRRRMDPQLRRCAALAAACVLTHCLLTAPAFLKETDHWISTLRRAALEREEHGQHRSHRHEKEHWIAASAADGRAAAESAKYAQAAALVDYVLTRLLGDLHLLYFPAGVLILLPINLSCRRKSEKKKEEKRESEFDLQDLDSSVVAPFVANGVTGVTGATGASSSPYSSRRHLRAADFPIDPGGGSLRFEKRRAKKNGHQSAAASSSSSRNLRTTAAAAAAAVEFEEDVVAAEVHQRLSRSRTTVV